jgi:hypothetical protein
LLPGLLLLPEARRLGLLLEPHALLLALLQHALQALRLLLRDLPLRRLLLLRELEALARHDVRAAHLVVAEHAREARLRAQVLLVRRARGRDARGLDRRERLAVRLLLHLVVLREERPLLLAVRALDVVDALRDDAQALLQLLLLLLELRDLDGDEVLGVVGFQFLQYGESIIREKEGKGGVPPRRSA